MIKKLFDRVFLLPPVNQRRNVKQSIVRFFGVWFPVNDRDDIYIYYLHALWIIRICTVFSTVYIGSYVLGLGFDLYFFAIPDPSNKIITLIKSYNENVATFLLLVLYPLFLLKYRWNIDPKKHDVLWYNPRYIKQGYRSRWKIIIETVVYIIVSLLSLRYAYMAVQGIPLKFLYSETIYSYAFYLLIISIAFIVFLQVLLIGSIRLWRYIGKYEGK